MSGVWFVLHARADRRIPPRSAVVHSTLQTAPEAAVAGCAVRGRAVGCEKAVAGWDLNEEGERGERGTRRWGAKESAGRDRAGTAGVLLVSLSPFGLLVCICSRAGLRFNDHGGPVAEHFGRPAGAAAADFGRVVAKADHRIGAQRAGVVDQKVISLLAGLFAHLCIRTDLHADERFEPAENALGDR